MLAGVLAVAAGTLVATACSGGGGGGSGARPAPGFEAVGVDAYRRVRLPSAGCDTSAVREGASVETLPSGGVERAYIREVPPGHDGEEPMPLVVDLHGWGGPALAHADYTQLGRLGASRGFVTLTPQGRGAPPAWDASVDGPDVAFVGDLLDEAEGTLCVDTRRIFVVGASNGAMLASALACTSGGRIAAVGAVAGVSPVLPARVDPERPRCRPARAVPMVAIHGTADPVIRFSGGFAPGVAALPGPDGVPLGERQRPTTLSIPEVMGVWAERDGCDVVHGRPEPVEADVRRLTWRCPAGTAVELYVVQGGGHGWPGAKGDPGWAPLAEATSGGGLAETSDVSADKLLWAFFAGHPLPRPTPERGFLGWRP